MLVESLTAQSLSETPRGGSTGDLVRAAESSARAEARASSGGNPGAERGQAQSSRSSRSRLTYDTELSRVFVEIVDPKSGEVVQRFPPEQLVRHMSELIDQDLLDPGAGDPGLVFDKVV